MFSIDYIEHFRYLRPPPHDIVGDVRRAWVWNRLINDRMYTYPDTTFHDAYPSASDLENRS